LGGVDENEKILKGNITNIDKNGLVTILFSQELDNSIFNITKNTSIPNLPRYLEENEDNSTFA